jgi:DNA-binding MarR family transcriptional regulator
MRRESTAPAESIGYLLRRAHKLSVALAEDAFVGGELSFIQWLALMLLREDVVDTCGGLARCLDHDSGATTRMLDQLEARGLIARQRSAVDRRVVHLVLTEAGRAATEALMPRIAGMWHNVLAGFDAGEVTLLTGLLQRLVVRLEAQGAARGLA